MRGNVWNDDYQHDQFSLLMTSLSFGTITLETELRRWKRLFKRVSLNFSYIIVTEARHRNRCFVMDHSNLSNGITPWLLRRDIVNRLFLITSRRVRVWNNGIVSTSLHFHLSATFPRLISHSHCACDVRSLSSHLRWPLAFPFEDTAFATRLRLLRKMRSRLR